ncbi:MAG TPA: LLM class flavin-dependent oxidoreductase, partial [Pseudonocardiaceae bacterium]|nr:LLM class flavin-dependent oxidoreductase [Pseudonocardiaceae bacterium]
LPPGEGTGLGKPLKIINRPVRENIPILVAAIGPKNVELSAEVANGWEPMFYLPELATQVWGDALAEGSAKRDPALGELDIVVAAPLAITDDRHTADRLLDAIRPMYALYLGGMGAQGRNFYHNLACRYGFEAAADVVQELYLDGKKDAAAAAVPDDLVRRTSLIGPAGHVHERLGALRDSGVSTLNVTPLAGSAPERVTLIERIKDLAGGL